MKQASRAKINQPVPRKEAPATPTRPVPATRRPSPLRTGPIRPSAPPEAHQSPNRDRSIRISDSGGPPKLSHLHNFAAQTKLRS